MIPCLPSRAIRLVLNALMAAVTVPLAVALLPPAPARAGDIARVEVLGFDRQGSRFAFEQYGIEDGSGFPWSEIFVIDVAADRWIAPSPIRFREEIAEDVPDLEALLADTRHVTRQSAQDLGLLDGIMVPGHMAGHDPITELDRDGTRMQVLPRPVLPPIDAPLTFTLETYPLPDSTCATYGADTAGFRLTLSRAGEAPRKLHVDSALPKSRGCALDYRIERVITHIPGEGPAASGVFAVLVFVETLGFEGPNGRYLAITGTF
ncbi:DUF2259 domain-containing protein [Roseibium aestuarii]|uniref:DUF2259 domain-containing protein n=1 Tax=Roseibium aestuarii TaxID=2600299 RepID=A0ABW4JZ21_9HYPH|nr:DUF2259 domain-containing protein [Roseibium aestuarii]